MRDVDAFSGCSLPGDVSSYPKDLASFVRDRWSRASERRGGIDLLPDALTLENFLSVCFHASLMREEGRPVTFRAVLAPAALFAPEGRPPDGLQRLDFSRGFPFHPSEVRRLSVAVDPQRTLIGVRTDGEGGLEIWGLIHSGTRWLRDVQGGRQTAAPFPPATVVHVEAPGSIEVYRGFELVGKLQGGSVSGARIDLFESKWLPEQFRQFQDVLRERHETARNRAREHLGDAWAPLEPMLTRRIAERMLKRVLSLLREARHGGTIVFFPLDDGGTSWDEEHYIDLRYKFAPGPPRLCFPDLIVDILNRLAQRYGGSDQHRPGMVSWQEFETTTDEELITLDEALFEMAQLIAELAATDGAVVLTKNHELLGFGGMISGRLPAVKSVARALDLEGELAAEEDTGNVGARHRSAYRLAGAVPGSVTVVISQDGGVRFVCQKVGRVTYWEQE
jgi:hypothetical protein